MAARISRHHGRRVIGVDLVPERQERVRQLGIEVLDLSDQDDLAGAIREMTAGRRPDAVLDAVGMEAHGGAADPLPTLRLFDKRIQVRQGQANVKRWVDDLPPLLTDDDPLGVDGFATHHLPLSDAPTAYERFQKKQDGMIKVVFNP